MEEEEIVQELEREEPDNEVLDRARELAVEKEKRFNYLLLLGTAGFLALTVQASPPKSFGEVQFLPAFLLYTSWATGLVSLFCGFWRAELDLAHSWNLFLAMTMTKREREALSGPLSGISSKRSSAYPIQRFSLWSSLALFALFKFFTTSS